jgi:isochorismate hydrolase
VDEVQPTIEENGFLILDLTPESMTLRFFKWRYDPVERIDALEPFRTTQLKRV